MHSMVRCARFDRGRRRVYRWTCRPLPPLHTRWLRGLCRSLTQRSLAHPEVARSTRAGAGRPQLVARALRECEHLRARRARSAQLVLRRGDDGAPSSAAPSLLHAFNPPEPTCMLILSPFSLSPIPPLSPHTQCPPRPTHIPHTVPRAVTHHALSHLCTQSTHQSHTQCPDDLYTQSTRQSHTQCPDHL